MRFDEGDAPPLRVEIGLAGNSHVGKSALFLRYFDNTFEENLKPTIGVDFRLKLVEVDDQKVQVKVWDTAGQERFHSTPSTNMFRKFDAVLVVYDLADRDSFMGVGKWLGVVDQYAARHTVKALAGNKLDLEGERQVPGPEAKAFADQKGMLFSEASAKQGVGVEETFTLIVRRCLQVQQELLEQPATAQAQQSRSSVALHEKPKGGLRGFKCCGK